MPFVGNVHSQGRPVAGSEPGDIGIRGRSWAANPEKLAIDPPLTSNPVEPGS